MEGVLGGGCGEPAGRGLEVITGVLGGGHSLAETVGQTSASKYSELATNIISTKQACITDDAYSPLVWCPQFPDPRHESPGSHQQEGGTRVSVDFPSVYSNSCGSLRAQLRFPVSSEEEKNQPLATRTDLMSTDLKHSEPGLWLDISRTSVGHKQSQNTNLTYSYSENIIK